MSRFKVSVLIPTYNRASFIEQAIQSVLTQPHSNECEIIIADDGSIDNTEDVVKNLLSDQVRYFKLAKQGAPATRNFAIQQATSQYLLNLDSDDILLTNTLKMVFDSIAAFPEIDVFYGDLIVTDQLLNPISVCTYQDFYQRGKELPRELFAMNQIPNGGICLKASAFKKVGLYNTEFRRAHDYEWFTRAARLLEFKHFGDFSGTWRKHGDNLSFSESGSSMDVDTSFEARVIQGMLYRYSLRELFPNAGWDRRAEDLCERECFGRIALKFEHWKDLEKADYYRKLASA